VYLEELTMPSLPSIRGRGAQRPSAGHVPVPLSHYVVDCAVYVDGKRLPGRWTHTDAVKEVSRRKDGFVWIGLHEPDAEQIEGIAETFGLHELAVEDAVHAHQRPKLERYDNTLFMVFKTVRYVTNESPDTANEIVESGEIMVFLGKDFVITVRHGNHSGLSKLRHVLEADPERLEIGPAAVMHAIADQVVDNYLEVTDHIEDDIDRMEERVFAPRSQVSAEQIYMFKREVVELRRAVMPLANPLRRLAEGYTPLIPEQVRAFFRDVDDHLTEVSERVTAFDELLTTLVDATLAKITLQQNTDMRKITSWVAIISVPTMVVGVYGMNFDYMPELKWKFGYPLVMSLVLIACLTLYRILRRNRWL
jgi:magnesium transporter